MDPTRQARQRPPSTTVRSIAIWAVLACTLGAWWLWLAPASLGGGTSYVIVVGSSMEPALYDGDLVLARRAADYEQGDLVVMHAAYGGETVAVIHRLFDRVGQSEWHTKGDNVSHLDPWVVSDNEIVGRYWFHVPQVGNWFAWLTTHPWQYGAGASLLTLFVYLLPTRRRKIPDNLASHLARAEREPRRDGRATEEYVLLATSALGALATAFVIVQAYASGVWNLAAKASVAGFILSGGFTWWLLYRLYDGVGKLEPAKSSYALAGRTWLVEEFPELADPAQPVKSAVALRNIAEKYRMPILHRINQATGHHQWLLVTVQLGNFIWEPVVPETRPAVSDEAPFDFRRLSGRHGKLVSKLEHQEESFLTQMREIAHSAFHHEPVPRPAIALPNTVQQKVHLHRDHPRHRASSSHLTVFEYHGTSHHGAHLALVGKRKVELGAHHRRH